MRSSFAFAVLACLAGAGALPAQRPAASAPASAFELTPYAGYMIFGSYLEGPLGTSLTNAPGALYGAQVGMALTPAISLVGNVGYSSSDVQVGLPLVGGVSVGSSNLLLYDAGVQFALPFVTASGLALKPFVQAGIGAMRYQIDESILHTQATNVAANAGVGADVGLGRSVGIRVMAKDYVGKFDFKEATSLNVQGETAHNWGLTGGLRLSF
ncbi:MAG TPA: hypothetical protein VJU87_01485 [Gemmatimonadaceae bacterium]|nr:hypothetical protein [Gemmatimonadaceae bacterium]